MIRTLAFLFLLTLTVGTTAAQVMVTGDTVATQSAPADTGFMMAKSPSGAMLRSAIIPGWGQYYNESYWKIPIVVGLCAWMIRGIVVENASFIEYRDKYDASITATTPAGNLIYKQYREYYRDNRDSYAWYLGLFYLIQIADAFIDAHLFDFSVSDVATASMLLLPSGRLDLRIRF